MNFLKYYRKKRADKDILQENFFIEEGIAYLGYNAAGKEDIINAFSVKGYEVLNEEFTDYIDMLLPHVPSKMPLALEISGCSFTDEEEETICDAIWNHFHIILGEINNRFTKYHFKMLWFLLSMLATYLLTTFDGVQTADYLRELLYIPFYFFGYRLLDYAVFDYYPLLTEKRQCEQMIGMKILFAADEDEDADTPEDKLVAKYNTEARRNLEEAREYSFKNVLDDFVLEDGIAYLACKIDNTADAIRKAAVSGYELITAGLEDYIEYFSLIVPSRCPVIMEITRDNADAQEFTPEEQELLSRAIRNHFKFKMVEKQGKIQESVRRIVGFTLATAIVIFLLAFCEKLISPYTQDFIVLLLWFFADYLAEFVLIDLRQTINEKNSCAQMLCMKITYTKDLQSAEVSKEKLKEYCEEIIRNCEN